MFKLAGRKVIIGVDEVAQFDQLIANDPANGLNSYDLYLMRVIAKSIVE